MVNKLLIGILLVCASTAASADQKGFDMKAIEARTASAAQSGTTASTAASPAASIAEGDMSVEALDRLFKNAFFKTTIEGEDRIVIQISADRGARIHIDRQHKLLFFYKVFGFKGQAKESSRIDLANRINASVILVRASVPGDHTDSLVIDYYLPYEEAVPTYQIVNALRNFSEVAVKAVSQYDSEDIVE